MAFKENIKARRKELGYTIEYVSKQLGVSKPTVQRYESGVISNIPYDKVEALAEILSTTPSMLMDWEEDLLCKYKALDDLGKHTVEVVLTCEYNRCHKK